MNMSAHVCAAAAGGPTPTARRPDVSVGLFPDCVFINLLLLLQQLPLVA